MREWRGVVEFRGGVGVLRLWEGGVGGVYLMPLRCLRDRGIGDGDEIRVYDVEREGAVLLGRFEDNDIFGNGNRWVHIEGWREGSRMGRRARRRMGRRAIWNGDGWIESGGGGVVNVFGGYWNQGLYKALMSGESVEEYGIRVQCGGIFDTLGFGELRGIICGERGVMSEEEAILVASEGVYVGGWRICGSSKVFKQQILEIMLEGMGGEEREVLECYYRDELLGGRLDEWGF